MSSTLTYFLLMPCATYAKHNAHGLPLAVVRRLEQLCTPEQAAAARAALLGAGSSGAADAGPAVDANGPLPTGAIGDGPAAQQGTASSAQIGGAPPLQPGSAAAAADAGVDGTQPSHNGPSDAAAALPATAAGAPPDVKSPEDAIAALDRLLAVHGVPAMHPQPPPGLIGAAA